MASRNRDQQPGRRGPDGASCATATRGAFEVLYDRHAGAAFSLAYRMVGNRNVAEDIVQEAFLSIWRSRVRYAPSAAACAPGCSASSTTARSTPCAATRCTTAAARAPRASRSARRRPSAPTWRSPAATRLARCARRSTRCPDEQSQVIELSYFGGFTHTQIAEMLEQPDRHREGPHAAGTGEAAPRARGAGGLMTDWHDDRRRRRGAYLLGALVRPRAPGLRDATWTSCVACREELEHLRPAAEALPRSVSAGPPARQPQAGRHGGRSRGGGPTPAASASRDAAQPARPRALAGQPGPRGRLGERLVPAARRARLRRGWAPALLSGDDGADAHAPRRTRCACPRPPAA